MEIRLTCPSDAAAISTYYLNNSQHLAKWEPKRETGFHSVDAWHKRLLEQQLEFAAGRSAHFAMFDETNQQVVALCSLTNIVGGGFQACNLGYSVAESYQGKGQMKKLCQHAIDYGFTKLELNRIMANYMPCNVRSAALLESLGFEKEGMAKKYLKINGQWEDHILTSLLNPQGL